MTAANPYEINFFTLGDWGENSYQLRSIGEEMAKWQQAKHLDFVIPLGDNFYDDGVESVTDPLWIEVFENNFKNVTCPWYPVLGNHDYHTNINAQLEYPNPKWQMEAPYYTKTMNNVQFIFIDTTTLCPAYSQQITGIDSFKKLDAKKQYKWLRKTLAASTAEWILVFGHYPVYSGGENGSTKDLIRQLEPILAEFQVDAYFCGHDHSMQHLFNEDTDMHYFVNGAGCGRNGMLRSLPQTLGQTRIPGFLHCNVNSDRLIVNFISFEGKKLHSSELVKKVKMYRTSTSDKATRSAQNDVCTDHEI